MIDVVYKLGSGSKWENRELRYSLRSLSYFKDLGKVYVVGYRPDWIKNITHIPASDPHLSNKDCNLINKIILASQDPYISQQFLNFSDDQVLLKECSVEDFITPYYDNSLIQFLPNQQLNRWKTRLKNTIRALQEKGFSANCYESHIPILIDKNSYTRAVFQYNYPEGQGMCGNTLYINTTGKRGDPLPKDYAVRFEGNCPELSVLESMCEGKLHLNYAEATTNENLFVFLQSKFGIKSIYEND